MRHTFLTMAVISTVSAACSGGPDLDAVFGGESGRWIDLSYTFSDESVYWPTAEPFELEVVSFDSTEAGFFYAANNFSAAEHGGTHLDSPIHFSAGQWSTHEIPVDRLIGPAFVISPPVGGNPDYQVSADDLRNWESEHGQLPRGAIVLLNTGWGSRYPDREAYLGTSATGDSAVALLHFPGLHPEAAALLVERGIDAFGIDTPSIDFGQSSLFESHQILFGANIPAFENVAHLDRMPATGAYVVALPMNIEGGSGGPLRIVGYLP